MKNLTKEMINNNEKMGALELASFMSNLKLHYTVDKSKAEELIDKVYKDEIVLKSKILEMFKDILNYDKCDFSKNDFKPLGLPAPKANKNVNSNATLEDLAYAIAVLSLNGTDIGEMDSIESITKAIKGVLKDKDISADTFAKAFDIFNASIDIEKDIFKLFPNIAKRLGESNLISKADKEKAKKLYKSLNGNKDLANKKYYEAKDIIERDLNACKDMINSSAKKEENIKIESGNIKTAAVNSSDAPKTAKGPVITEAMKEKTHTDRIEAIKAIDKYLRERGTSLKALFMKNGYLGLSAKLDTVLNCKNPKKKISYLKEVYEAALNCAA